MDWTATGGCTYAEMAGGSNSRGLQSVLTDIELELVVFASDDHLSSFP